mgnify:FL=1
MSETSPETPASDEPPASSITAPGAAAAVPQEQLDRAVALLLHAMQLRNYVELHRGRLPADLGRRWDEWYRGLAEVFQRVQADSIAQRQVLAQLPTYQAELTRYRDALAAHGAPAQGPPPLDAAASREPRQSLSTLLVGGAGLAVGLVAGFAVAGSRG